MEENINNADDIMYMKKAIELAKTAFDCGEVPIGAVVVCDGAVVGSGYNYRETGKNALYHAEIAAIDSACKKLGGWRLHRCTLYVTVEPCIMCAGALINSRMKRVVFGAKDIRFGAFGSIFDANAIGFNHRPEIISGVLEDECSALMRMFFENLRKKS